MRINPEAYDILVRIEDEKPVFTVVSPFVSAEVEAAYYEAFRYNEAFEAFREYSALFAALLPPFVPQYGRLGLDALGGPKPDGKGA